MAILRRKLFYFNEAGGEFIHIYVNYPSIVDKNFIAALGELIA